MRTIDRSPRAFAEEGGQSLVEVALALPVLLLIVIGIVDIGRLYAYKVAVTNAAREAAFYGARDPQSAKDGTTGICQRARNELGVGTNTNPCGNDMTSIKVDCLRGGLDCAPMPTVPALFQTVSAGGGDVTVTVTYKVSLLSAYLVGRAFVINPVPISSTATFVGLGQ
ncbi:MAG TPA: TadE/TadG family type IV pilus assembly protein [Candidatus Limnocylindria bacterium]